jgi:hypothetical protein
VTAPPASNHDGDVLVTSTEGEGSTFVLRLPLCGPSNAIAADQDVGGPTREGIA